MYYLIYCKFFQKTILLVNWIRIFRNTVMKNLDRPWIFPFIFARFKFNELQGSCMHLILGTWYNSLTLNTTIDKSCKAKKKKRRSYWLLKSCANDSWTIVPTTVKKLCQWLLNNCARDSWTIMSRATAAIMCQMLLFNYASHCWRILPATCEKLCQWFSNNQLCQGMLNNEISN